MGNYLENNTTSWLHLASWNFPDSELSWETKMEPSVAIIEPNITKLDDMREYKRQMVTNLTSDNIL